MRSWVIGFTGAVLLLLLLLGSASAQGNPSALGRTGGSRWGANYFPNVPLITHEGDSVRFFDDLIKDKVVVINFIYTSCPDVCPLETARLTELQAILGDRVGRDVCMYSITIDPANDTPEVLKKYADGFQVGPGWLFLTGKESDIVLLRRKLGLYIEEIQDDSNDHNLSLLIGNQGTGRWMKRSPFENPYFLADQVGSWLHNWKTPAPNQQSYANAPSRLRKLSQGETLFRTRCAACHVIGGGDQVPPHQSGRPLGPDLLNVTKRRDKKWLARWLAEPDQMLAEEDPLAMALFAKHNLVAMPNMSLNPHDVAAVMDYLETESRRVERVQQLTEAAGISGSPGGGSVCCQKDKAPVLGGSQDTARTASPEEEQSQGGWVLADLFTGLGCVFLLLAILIRLRGTSMEC